MTDQAAAILRIVLIGGLAGLGTLALVRRRGQLVGTTLIAPWWWACGSLWAVGSGEVLLALAAGDAVPAWQPHLRYALAVTTLLPLMAVLGAKRPQDRGWQWVVLSLWVVLNLPVAQAVIYVSREPVVLHPAWGWFLAGLVLLGIANWIATRYWSAALLAAAAQMLLLADQLPWSLVAASPWRPVAALALGVTAIGLWARKLPRVDRVPVGNLPVDNGLVGRSLDRVWLDFRDLFGALWSLRVAQRVNAAAEMYDWNVRLGWGGFRAIGPLAATAAPEQPAATPPAAEPAAATSARIDPAAVTDRAAPTDRAAVTDRAAPTHPPARVASFAPSDPAAPSDRTAASDPAVRAALVQNFWSLLRRFVSAEWVRERGIEPGA